MRKSLTAIAVATMVFSSTAAHAVTRPEPTDFTKPVTGESSIGNEVDEDDGTLLLIFLGLGGLLGILLAAGSSNGNSPR